MRFGKIILFLTFIVLFCGNTTLDRSLIVAISKGDFLRVNNLVESGANVNAVYHKGKTALHWAVSGGNFKITAYLVYKGARIDAVDEIGATPLQLAAIGRNLDIIKLLVQSGANVEHIDRNGWDVLHYYTFYEFGIGVKFLLTQGVALTNKTKRKYLDVPVGLTPLDIAYKKNYLDIIKTLEEPYKFTSLAQKPIIQYSLGGVFTTNTIIGPLEKAYIILNITNLGGIEARNLKMELTGISNTSDIEFDNSRVFNLSSGEAKEIILTLKGLTSISKSERAFFEFYLINENISNIHRFNIQKIYKPVPDPVVMAVFRYPFEIISGSKTNLVFRIENRGKGSLENANLKISFLNTNIIENEIEFSNINISPLSFKEFNASLTTIENLEIKGYENVKARLVFSSSILNTTNYFDFKIVALPLPELDFSIGSSENSFTNIFIGEKGSNVFSLSNKNNDGKNIELKIQTISLLTNVKTIMFNNFLAGSSVNFYLEDFTTNEQYKTLKIDVYYKNKNIFQRTIVFTNTNYVEFVNNTNEVTNNKGELK